MHPATLLIPAEPSQLSQHPRGSGQEYIFLPGGKRIERRREPVPLPAEGSVPASAAAGQAGDGGTGAAAAAGKQQEWAKSGQLRAVMEQEVDDFGAQHDRLLQHAQSRRRKEAPEAVAEGSGLAAVGGTQPQQQQNPQWAGKPKAPRTAKQRTPGRSRRTGRATEAVLLKSRRPAQAAAEPSGECTAGEGGQASDGQQEEEEEVNEEHAAQGTQGGWAV